MTPTRSESQGEPGDETAWLEALLRAARPPDLDDAGFSAAVQARIAVPKGTVTPAAALAAAGQAERRVRRHGHWTIAGALVGALVAALAAQAGPGTAVDPAANPAPALALLAASTVLAWLAISRKLN